MFELIKQNVDLVDLIEKDLGLVLIPSGENFVIENERDVGGCPFCGHNDCFKVKHDESNKPASFYHCFSCEVHGDVVGWRAQRKNITMYEAAVGLAQDFNIELPNNYDPNQEIFRLAARYYHNCLVETCNVAQKCLSGKTPLEYQTQVRKHEVDTLQLWQVGFSDGALIDYLESLGLDSEVIANSGLANAKGKDLIPRGVFVYPHLSNEGRVSHFTLKDPTHKFGHQLKKKHTLNGVKFFGQQTLGTAQTVVLVEGENDVLSSWETGKVPAVLGSIGQISAEQLEWLKENLAGKNVVTIFDNDEAGDKYRIKVERLRPYFRNLAHIHPGEFKDIDDALKTGEVKFEEFIVSHRCTVTASNDPKVAPKVEVSWDQSLYESKSSQSTEESEAGESDTTDGAFQSHPEQEFKETLKQAGLSTPGQAGNELVVSDPGSHIFKEIPGLNVVQKGYSYYKVLVNKDGDTRFKSLSDFAIELRNVFVTDDGTTEREVILIREDGKRSKPFLINSETKVKVPQFKVVIADKFESSFVGNEEDLAAIWKLVFLDSAEKVVHLTKVVGYHDALNGWLFGNVFISNSGKVVQADKDDVCWLQPSEGVRALSVELNKSTYDSVPTVVTSMTTEEKDQLLKGVIDALADNRNDIGQAITLVAWTYSCVYSQTIFDLNKGFPFLFLWGLHGKGKTTIARWMQDFFSMRGPGYTSVPQLGSGVGLRRKAAYFSSMPILIDEVRSDRETEEHLGTFRSYYDRTSKGLGVRESFGVKTDEVRSTFIFGGEDQFEDQATRERCISMRIPAREGEPTSYTWLEENRHLFSGITFNWILEAAFEDKQKLIDEIRDLDKQLVEAKCSPRSAKNWAAIGVLGLRLAQKYRPDFDYLKYLKNASTYDRQRQKQETTLVQFFELIESIQAQENSAITNRHIMANGNELYLWFPALYKIVRDEERGRFPFSKMAVLSALREEPYFISDDRKITMGMDGVRRTVITLDLTIAPEIVKNIAFSNS